MKAKAIRPSRGCVMVVRHQAFKDLSLGEVLVPTRDEVQSAFHHIVQEGFQRAAEKLRLGRTLEEGKRGQSGQKIR